VILKCVSSLCRWSRRTVQQIQRCGVQSSCKSYISHGLRLQVCRWYGRLLLETLTVHGWTSCRMSIRLAVSRYSIILQEQIINSEINVINVQQYHRSQQNESKIIEGRRLLNGQQRQQLMLQPVSHNRLKDRYNVQHSGGTGIVFFYPKYTKMFSFVLTVINKEYSFIFDW